MKNILKLIIIITFTLQSNGVSSSIRTSDALRPKSFALQSAAGKASSAAATVMYETVLKDGKLNVFLLEKLLSEEATALLQQEIPRPDMDVRVRFVGSAKYLCDDDGWLLISAVESFDVHAVLDKRAYDFSPEDIIKKAIKRVSERVTQTGQSDISLDLIFKGRLNWVMLLFDKYERSRLESGYKSIRHKVAIYQRDYVTDEKMFRVSMHQRHRVEDDISIMLERGLGAHDLYLYLSKRAKYYIQILYYFGNVDTYKRYRDRFLEVYADDYFDGLVELAIEMQDNEDIIACMDRINRKAVPNIEMSKELKVALDEPKSVAGPIQIQIRTNRLLQAIASKA